MRLSSLPLLVLVVAPRVTSLYFPSGKTDCANAGEGEQCDDDVTPDYGKCCGRYGYTREYVKCVREPRPDGPSNLIWLAANCSENTICVQEMSLSSEPPKFSCKKGYKL